MNMPSVFRTRVGTTALLASMVVLTCSASAMAKDLNVANPSSPANCAKNAQYMTIQAAVTAAAPGDHIKVCPGTYPEQVRIPAGKDGISLQGNGNPRDANQPANQQTVIKAPPAMVSPKSIVEVSQSQNVKIMGFTISGPGDGGCDSIEEGVRVDQGGSADIEQNHITQIEDTPPGGCQNGVGIQVGRNAESTTGTATIKNNTIDQYQKGGIVVDNTGSSADIENNLVLGQGTAIAKIAANGIQISRGATAKVANNTVAGNQYSLAESTGTESIGILLYQPGGPTDIEHNILQVQQDHQPPSATNDIGIYDYAPSGSLLMDSNNVFGQAFNGIVIDADSGDTVARNNMVAGTTTNFGGPNGVDSGDGFLVYDGSTGSLLQNNQSNNNAEDGFHLDSTTSNNTLRDNKASGNVMFDCADDSTGSGTAGTANSWINDHGLTSSRPGICHQ